MSKRLQWLIRILSGVAALLCLPAIITVAVFAEPRQTVRVGFPELKYFSEISEDGSYSGLVYDYAMEISKYTGWKLDFVTGGLQELIDQLESGQVDLMGGILRNEQTEAIFDFAEYNSGFSYSVLAAKEDDKRYSDSDYQSFEGMRVAVYQNAVTRIASFESFCTANKIKITPVYYDNSKDYENALKTNEADCILTNDTSVTPEQRIVARFAPVPYYFAVTKGNAQVLRGVNTTLAKLIEINPRFDTNLYQKYFESNRGYRVHLSDEEERYIKQLPVLRVAVDQSFAPFENSGHSGEAAAGIGPDVLAHIAEITGLRFSFQPASDFSQTLALIQSGQADMLLSLAENLQNAEEYSVTLTKPYLNTQTVMVANRNVDAGALENKIMAYPRGRSYSQYAIADKKMVRTYDTVEECFRAVNQGQADYTYANSLTVEYYVRGRGLDQLSLTPLANYNQGICLGLVRPTDPTLLSILDKAIYGFSDDDVRSIVFQNTAQTQLDFTLSALIKANPLPSILIVLIVALTGMTLLFMVMHARTRLARQITLDAERYRLIADIADEYLFEYDFISEELTFSEKFAKLTGRKTLRRQYGQEENSGDTAGMAPFFFAFDPKQLSPNPVVDFHCRLADGSEEWFRAVCAIIFNAQNKPVQGIGKITSIQKEHCELAQLSQQANFDELTGLSNRRFCENEIRSYLLGESRGGGVLIVIDLDHFKDVNDQMGHNAGDLVLKDFSGVLHRHFRALDVIGRWGGDEFLVFMKGDYAPEIIHQKMEGLCRVMYKAFAYEGKRVQLSISAGVVLAGKDSTYETLFEMCDRALYKVKRGKRNGFEMISENEAASQPAGT